MIYNILKLQIKYLKLSLAFITFLIICSFHERNNPTDINLQSLMISQSDSLIPQQLTCDSFFYPEKSLSQVVIFEPESRISVIKKYYSSGQISKLEIYQEKIRIGKWKEWHLNGVLKESGHYVCDENETAEDFGIIEIDSSQTGIAIGRFYYGGVKNGTWEKWNSKGLLIKSESFVMGKLHGPQLEYDDSGILIYRTDWNMGNKVQEK